MTPHERSVPVSSEQSSAFARRGGARRDRSMDDDATLIRDISDRQPGALAEVYDRHGVRLYNLTRRLCGDDYGEGVVQDVLMGLWERPEQFDPDRGSLRAYLTVATCSRAIDVLRSAASRRDREHAVEAARQRSPYGRTDPPPDAGTWSAVALLPVDEREPIALAFLFGFTYREVASRLDLPEDTVKGRIRTGLRRLHKLLTQRARES